MLWCQMAKQTYKSYFTALTFHDLRQNGMWIHFSFSFFSSFFYYKRFVYSMLWNIILIVQAWRYPSISVFSPLLVDWQAYFWQTIKKTISSSSLFNRMFSIIFLNNETGHACHPPETLELPEWMERQSKQLNRFHILLCFILKH